MKIRILIIVLLFLFLSFVPAGAADYRFTYKKGKVSVDQNTVKTGKDSVAAFSWGAAAEVRCGPGSELGVNSVTKTGEAVFTLKSGSCFIRIIDDGSGASVRLNTPFAVLKSADAALYADCTDKSASVFSGSAGITFGGRIARLTSGRTFSSGKMTEIKPGVDAFRDWAMNRDKDDLVINLQAEKKRQENTGRVLGEALTKAYGAGKLVFSNETAPEDIFVSVTITTRQDGFIASGVISSGIDGNMGVIDIKKDTGHSPNPYESQAFMPFIYEIAAAVQKSIEQSEAGFMKNGRKTIIEAEGLAEADNAGIEKALRKMAGFISMDQKKYHNTKVVFVVLQAGTGYDIDEALRAKFKKTNINIWKYSKNIVKLRVVKAER